MQKKVWRTPQIKEIRAGSAENQNLKGNDGSGKSGNNRGS